MLRLGEPEGLAAGFTTLAEVREAREVSARTTRQDRASVFRTSGLCISLGSWVQNPPGPTAEGGTFCGTACLRPPQIWSCHPRSRRARLAPCPRDGRAPWRGKCSPRSVRCRSPRVAACDVSPACCRLWEGNARHRRGLSGDRATPSPPGGG